MNLGAKAEKWGPLILGVVCAFLIIRIVRQIRNGRPQPQLAIVSAKRPAVPKGLSPAGSADSALDPRLQMAQMRASEDRRPIAVARNPFEFVLPKPKVQPSFAYSQPASPPQPPPPPPLPLQALGYETETNGALEAYVTYQDQVFIVRAGDAIAKRYRIIQVAPKDVQVIDETTGQKGELPIPK